MRQELGDHFRRRFGIAAFPIAFHEAGICRRLWRLSIEELHNLSLSDPILSFEHVNTC
jgi:hypothetical protein